MSRENFSTALREAIDSPEMTVTQKGRVPSPAPLERRCAWCDDENKIRVTGDNITHGICCRHLVSNLVFCGQRDTVEALYYTVLCLIAEGQQ